VSPYNPLCCCISYAHLALSECHEDRPFLAERHGSSRAADFRRWRARTCRQQKTAVDSRQPEYGDGARAATSSLSLSTADKILKISKSYGPFKGVDDLRAIKGIGPKRMEKMRRYVTVGKPATLLDSYDYTILFPGTDSRRQNHR
jgi:hypothetical protein